MFPAGNKVKRLSSVKHTTKTIYHHDDERIYFNIYANTFFTYDLAESRRYIFYLTIPALVYDKFGRICFQENG